MSARPVGRGVLALRAVLIAGSGGIRVAGRLGGSTRSGGVRAGLIALLDCVSVGACWLATDRVRSRGAVAGGGDRGPDSGAAHGDGRCGGCRDLVRDLHLASPSGADSDTASMRLGSWEDRVT